LSFFVIAEGSGTETSNILIQVYLYAYTERTILLRDLKFCWIQIWK